MWADFDYYTNSYAGTLIPAQEFDALSVKAQKIVNYMTFNRAESDITDKVKTAVCAAAEAAYEVKQSYSNIEQGIKSESTDGHSVTYADVDYNTISVNIEKAMSRAIKRELSGTGLLYRGC